MTQRSIFDDTNQLTADGTASYSYDANGNRTMAGYATSTGNRTTNDGTWTYTFDDAGNEIKKSKGASAETWNYRYDHRNQLIAAEQYASDGGTLLAKVQYKYDALGDRIERDEDADGNGTYETVERFAYDGWNIWAQLDSNNSLVLRRLFGDAVDTPVARIKLDGSASWYFLDRRNSVVGLADGSGNALGLITYDGFGNILTDTTGTDGDDLKFTSRQYDSIVGLQYNRRRFYNPATGGWATFDPLGFGAGDPNLYRYVLNSPTYFGDPTGLFPILPVLSPGLMEWARQPRKEVELAFTNSFRPGIPVRTGPHGAFYWPIRWGLYWKEGVTKEKGVIIQVIKIKYSVQTMSLSGWDPRCLNGSSDDATPAVLKAVNSIHKGKPVILNYAEVWGVDPTKPVDVIFPIKTLDAERKRSWAQVGVKLDLGARFNDVFALPPAMFIPNQGRMTTINEGTRRPDEKTDQTYVRTRGRIEFEGKATYYAELDKDSRHDFSGPWIQEGHDSISPFITGAGGLMTLPLQYPPGHEHDEGASPPEVLQKTLAASIAKAKAASNTVTRKLIISWDDSIDDKKTDSFWTTYSSDPNSHKSLREGVGLKP